jgi:hypothetical protein
VFGPDEDGEGEPAPPAAYPSADKSFARLHAAGWSAGEAKELTPAGRGGASVAPTAKTCWKRSGIRKPRRGTVPSSRPGTWGGSAELSLVDGLD